MIRTESTTDTVPAEQKTAGADESNKSAPEAKAPEQKEVAKSDAAATEDGKEKAKEEDDTGPDAEADEAEAAAQEADKDKPKKKGGFQRRIDKLNAQKAAAQREAEHWKELALKGAGSEPKPDATQSDKPKVEPAGKPDANNFETYAEYLEAMTDWKIEQRDRAAKEKDAKAKLESEQETLLKTHSERVKAFAAKTADYDDVLAEVEDVRISAALEGLLVSSENGPELIYELAKDRAELERISKLGPLAAARELGKFESKIAKPKAESSETKKATEPKKTTSAPAPISPVGGKGGAMEKSIDDPSLTQAEYEAIRRKQRAAKAG